ncbi:unnamed protein product [Rotaria sordida]|uniref:RecQ mediated genome instability protein 1 OB-fold domain-containing protein n=3 Tax=Rotaria sordida TaxID=392033 RepID=A0A819GSA1_9BILA|nr:unnamed protein product [Rotaria sordida]
MNIEGQLISLGWSIKTDFFEKNKQQLDIIKKQLLDADLREIGEESLPEITKLDETIKPYIVQLHETRNVTAPKDKETSSNKPHLYRLTITDGHVFQNALILPSLKNFNLDTPPGVKLLLKPKTKILNGFYILNDQTCEVLGGTVNELVHKWKLNKLMDTNVRTLIGEEAPLPWAPFSTTHTLATTVDTSKRSMDVVKIQEIHEEDPEYIRQRRATIDNLLTGRISKKRRIAKRKVINGTNLAKVFELENQPMTEKRPKIASSSSLSTSVINELINIATSTEAIKVNIRLPKPRKKSITPKAITKHKKRVQSNRKKISKRKLPDDDNRSKQGDGSGCKRQRRGRAVGGRKKIRPIKNITPVDSFA